MGYEIPVIYAIYAEKCDSVTLSDWHDAIKLLERQTDWKNPVADGIRMCTCRNWWHQDLLGRICKGSHIPGLEFASLSQYWGCLCGNRLQEAQRGVEQVIQLLSSGVPDLSEWENESVQDLRQNLDAFHQAQIELKIDSPTWGFEATKCFCSHIKTLHFTINGAIKQNACLVYVLPPP